jgi:hypothetical protein
LYFIYLIYLCRYHASEATHWKFATVREKNQCASTTHEFY